MMQHLCAFHTLIEGDPRLFQIFCYVSQGHTLPLNHLIPQQTFQPKFANFLLIEYLDQNLNSDCGGGGVGPPTLSYKEEENLG